MQVNQVSTPLTLLQNVKAGIQTGLSTSVKFAGSVGKVFCKPLANALHGNTTTLTARTGAQGNPGNRLKGDALTRAQCKDLTNKIQDNMKEKSAGAKLMHARILPTLLPRMQTLAKTSQEDFNAYRNLVETAGKGGLLDKDMAAKVMDTQRHKPAETLGLLKVVSEFAGMAGTQGLQLKADMLDQIRSHLTNEAIPNGNPGLDLEPELDAYNNAQGEKKATARDKLFKKAWDQSVSRMETDLKSTKPKTAQEKALKKSLLSKLKKQGPESITERDLAKMGLLPGTSKSLLNTALLARYAYKEGNIKTTTYTAPEIKKAVKRGIKDALKNDKAALKKDPDALKSYENLSKGEKTAHDVKSVAAAFRKQDAFGRDEIIYLKNKLKTKIDDFLPPSGNDPWINKMNQAIREGVKKDLFIAPESLLLDGIRPIHSIGSGGGGATLSETEMIKEIAEKYGAYAEQFKELTESVNSSQKLALKAWVFRDKSTLSLEKIAKREGALNEIEISKQLDHPNIVKSYFSIQHHDANHREKISIAMDYCEKGDFSNVLKKDANNYDPGTSKGVKNIARVLLGAVKGLHQMHQLGYVHRDIKLENIFMTADNTPKVGDFGLTKKLHTQMTGIDSDAIKNLSDSKSISGTRQIGTKGHIPPETYKEHNTAPTQDTYSLGITALAAMFGGGEINEVKDYPDFDREMAKKDFADDKIKSWLGLGEYQYNKTVFDITTEGELMREFIYRSTNFLPEGRIGYDESVSLLNDIITY